MGSLIGLVLVLIGIFIGSLLKGVSPAAFFGVPAAFLIVAFSTLGAATMAYSTADLKRLPGNIKRAIRPPKGPSSVALVNDIVSSSERARRDGLLALEGDLAGIDDPFLKRGLQAAVDGADPETVKHILETDVAAMRARHKVGIQYLNSMGVYSPTFGIIGAVVGLIATLASLDDPEQLGHGIAAAFVATFWGVFLANGLLLPWSKKLAQLSAEEVGHRQMTIEGILAVQAGTSPRMVLELLSSFLSPADRDRIGPVGGARVEAIPDARRSA